MKTLTLICLFAALAAVLGVLVLGLLSLAKGGDFNRKWGNRLMQLRVGLQAVAVVLFLIAAAAGR